MSLRIMALFSFHRIKCEENLKDKASSVYRFISVVL